jgi:Spy/CpxP family protein refolding chaperone
VSERRVDFSSLDPARDEGRWEQMVENVLMRAEAPDERPVTVLRNELIENVKVRAAVVLVAVLFITGAASGAALWHTVAMPRRMPPPMPGPIPVHLLDLTPAQQKKVDAIFEAHRPALDEVLEETFPRIRAINEEIEKAIAEVLTPEQRKRIDDIKARRPDGPPPPMPPPGPHDRFFPPRLPRPEGAP